MLRHILYDILDVPNVSEESSADTSTGFLSIRLQNNDTTPEMYFNGKWNQLCAHHFADNDIGATLFCRKLGK